MLGGGRKRDGEREIIKYSIFLENKVPCVFFPLPIKIGEGWAEGPKHSHLSCQASDGHTEDPPTMPSTLYH